jgi:hypothetical protein
MPFYRLSNSKLHIQQKETDKSQFHFLLCINFSTCIAKFFEVSVCIYNTYDTNTPKYLTTSYKHDQNKSWYKSIME